ncbi:MAG TPA: Gfo/Idh/MocA family oxidoreductase [Candidatus Hydrogenedentes bacterium]|nr:Gfo/Idh/MocA family oxidoreductase [Candidatus Hydrogenedentota bacterium]HRT64843.1 Gfo/Idh/MocA family oxidoreductase [Candidatus Hydrogenedentota bacterium]
MRMREKKSQAAPGAMEETIVLTRTQEATLCDGAAKKPGKKSSRRDFLMTTAGAGAGMLFASKAFAQEAAAAAAPPAAAPAIVSPESKATQLNIALIGVGAEGQVLMDAALRIPGIRFKAVCDIWEYSRRRGAGMLKKFGHPVNAYVDYQDLLANETDIDAVIVATPEFVHAEHSIAAMKAGHHVYCEKEMSNDIEKARQMVLASHETGKLLQIGHQRRSNPRYQHAINRLVHENRLLGRVTHAYAQWNRSKSASQDLGWPKQYEIEPATLEKYGYASMHHFRNWRWYKKYGGGPMVDLGSHQVDIFSWVFGVMPKAVYASGGVDFYLNHEWYDNVLCIYEYENAEGIARAFYQVLTTTSHGGFYEQFMGEDGTLAISEVPQRGDALLRETGAPDWQPFAKQGLLAPMVTAAAPAAKSKDVAVDVRVSALPDSWPLPIQFNKPPHQAHLENFFDAIRLGTPLSCPGEIGYETAVAVLKVNQAVEMGQRLTFAPEEFKA